MNDNPAAAVEAFYAAVAVGDSDVALELLGSDVQWHEAVMVEHDVDPADR